MLDVSQVIDPADGAKEFRSACADRAAEAVKRLLANPDLAPCWRPYYRKVLELLEKKAI